MKDDTVIGLSDSLELILEYLVLQKTLDRIVLSGQVGGRGVCKTFNDVGSKFLSRSFFQLEKRHASIHKKVKSQLPRRESERRAHPLSRHCDILQAVETRMSMLNMTYNKYIESNVLCFIPGKVLDEIKCVLTLVENDQNPPRTHQLLQELRDLSSMAMEHFDEHILPRVQEQVDRRSAISYGSLSSGSKAPRLICAHHSLSSEIHKVKKQSKTHKHHISYLTQSTQKLFQKLRKQNMRIKAQSLKIREQQKKLQEQNTKIQEQEATLADLKKHIEEWDQKYKDLTTELVRAKEDFISVISQRTQAVPEQDPITPRLYKTNIKPRIAHILPKSYVNLRLDMERKRKGNGLNEIPVKQSKQEDQETVPHKNKISDILKLKTDKEKTDSNDQEIPPSKFSRSEFGQLIASLLLNPSLNIKNRKRKMQEDIDLK